jgi:hypothetical protein
MTLIRYQAPELAPWSPADRWSNLRDELNSFFELPFWSSSARAGQLFYWLVARARSLSEQRQRDRRGRVARNAQGGHRNLFA